MKRRGWAVAKEPPPSGPPRFFWRAGADKPEAVPAGIDPGFAYNPGKASMRAIADKAAATIERAAAYDLAMAREGLDDLVASPAFLKALNEPGTAFPVMVLDKATADLIGSAARVAVLSAETFAKQRRRHPELGVDLYRRLPEVGAAADIVAREGDNVLILAKDADGSWLVTVLKRTQSGAALFLQSFRVQSARSIARLLKGAEIVRDERKG